VCICCYWKLEQNHELLNSYASCCYIVFYIVIKYLDLSDMGRNRDNDVVYGVLLFVLYLVIFSNMATNIIFIAPVIILFMIQLYSFTKHIKAGTEKLCKKSVIVNFADYFVAFAFEIICLIFESSGGRARSLDLDLKTAIKEVFFDWQTIIKLMDIKIAVVSVIIIVIAIIMLVFDYRNKRDVRNISGYLGFYLDHLLYALPI